MPPTEALVRLRTIVLCVGQSWCGSSATSTINMRILRSPTPPVDTKSIASITPFVLTSYQTNQRNLTTYHSTLALTMGDLMEIEWPNARTVSTNPIQPLVKPRKPKARTLRDNDWEPYRKRLTELYTTGMSLKDVKRHMEVEFKFFAECVSVVQCVRRPEILTFSPGHDNTNHEFENGTSTKT
jgi:hypothetical protein